MGQPSYMTLITKNEKMLPCAPYGLGGTECLPARHISLGVFSPCHRVPILPFRPQPGIFGRKM